MYSNRIRNRFSVLSGNIRFGTLNLKSGLYKNSVYMSICFCVLSVQNPSQNSGFRYFKKILYNESGDVCVKNSLTVLCGFKTVDILKIGLEVLGSNYRIENSIKCIFPIVMEF